MSNSAWLVVALVIVGVTIVGYSLFLARRKSSLRSRLGARDPD